jgi:hypothetical protein
VSSPSIHASVFAAALCVPVFNDAYWFVNVSICMLQSTHYYCAAGAHPKFASAITTEYDLYSFAICIFNFGVFAALTH